MKKLAIVLGGVIIIAGLAFAALLVGTGPDDAPTMPVSVDIPDNFER